MRSFLCPSFPNKQTTSKQITRSISVTHERKWRFAQQTANQCYSPGYPPMWETLRGGNTYGAYLLKLTFSIKQVFLCFFVCFFVFFSLISNESSLFLLFYKNKKVPVLSRKLVKLSPYREIDQKQKKIWKNTKNTKKHMFWQRSVKHFTLFSF